MMKYLLIEILRFNSHLHLLVFENHPDLFSLLWCQPQINKPSVWYGELLPQWWKTPKKKQQQKYRLTFPNISFDSILQNPSSKPPIGKDDPLTFLSGKLLHGEKPPTSLVEALSLQHLPRQNPGVSRRGGGMVVWESWVAWPVDQSWNLCFFGRFFFATFWKSGDLK